MLAQKLDNNNLTEDPLMVSACDSMAPVFPQVTRGTVVQALMNVTQGDLHYQCTVCAATLIPLSFITASLEWQTMNDG
jgi:hypothetical protein